MLINFDPDDTPTVTDEMARLAAERGIHPVHVICDEPNAKVGDAGGVSFMALVSFIPRAGDRIVLEDGRRCEVRRVVYKVVTEKNAAGKAQCINLVPNVVAVLSEKERQQKD